MSLVIETNDIKMVSLLIKEGLVLDYILHECIRYNLACKVKQCLKYYKYSHISVYCWKNTRYRTCLDSHRILKSF